MYFYGWNLQLVARRPILDPGTYIVIKIGKGPLGNATNQLFKHLSQVISEEEDFLIFFLCISMI